MVILKHVFDARSMKLETCPLKFWDEVLSWHLSIKLDFEVDIWSLCLNLKLSHRMVIVIEVWGWSGSLHLKIMLEVDVGSWYLKLMSEVEVWGQV